MKSSIFKCDIKFPKNSTRLFTVEKCPNCIIKRVDKNRINAPRFRSIDNNYAENSRGMRFFNTKHPLQRLKFVQAREQVVHFWLSLLAIFPGFYVYLSVLVGSCGNLCSLSEKSMAEKSGLPKLCGCRSVPLWDKSAGKNVRHTWSY